MMDYEEWGSTGRQGVNQATEDRGPSRGPFARRAYWIDPDGLHAGGRHRGVWDAQLYLKLLRGAWL
jgi:hypothetical protein